MVRYSSILSFLFQVCHPRQAILPVFFTGDELLGRVFTFHVREASSLPVHLLSRAGHEGSK